MHLSLAAEIEDDRIGKMTVVVEPPTGDRYISGKDFASQRFTPIASSQPHSLGIEFVFP